MLERSSQSLTTAENIDPLIRVIRGQKVILDSDLARIYDAPVKRLNEQIKRNRDRFPTDFMFQLTVTEAESVRRSRSQFATLKRGHNIKYRPYAFTEHGALMAAHVLRSKRAVAMSVFVVRAFVRMRELLATNKVLAEKLVELERKLAARLDVHEEAIQHILDEIKKLIEPGPLSSPAHGPPRQMGFHVKDLKR